jgi:hypothetical protein
LLAVKFSSAWFSATKAMIDPIEVGILGRNRLGLLA